MDNNPGGMWKNKLFLKHMLKAQYILTGGKMIEIKHYWKNDKEVYTAIYLDDVLLVDWTPHITEINEIHPAIKEAYHTNSFIKD